MQDTRNPVAQPPPAALEREVLVEMVKLHARVLRHMPLIQALLAMGLALVVLPAVPTALFVGWACVVLLGEGLRARYGAFLLRHGVDGPGAPRAHGTLVALAVGVGVANGFAGVLFFPLLPTVEQALLGAVLFVIPATAVATGGSRYLVVAFAAAVIVPTTIAWGVQHPPQRLPVIALGALYTGLMLLMALESERLLRRSVAIRHERDRVVQDLEQRNADVREAMARVEQSADARARVLTAASNDLRQPLDALSGYNAILASRPAPEALRSVSQGMDQIVRSLSRLLDGLLDLSRASGRQQAPERQYFALDPLLARICDEFATLAAAKGLVLRHELMPTLLHGDAAAVARIARNLLDNALRYTDRGAVRLQLRRDGDAAVMTVADTGRGIAPAEQARVFEEFYRVASPGRAPGQGTGLGLAVVQRLAERIGARIALASALDQGTQLEVWLPGASDAASPAAAGLDGAASPSALAGRRVYMVDSAQDALRSVAALLILWRVEAFTAANAVDAEALFERHGAPDLLIADLQLRDSAGGCLLADQLRQAHGDFPVLLVAANTTASDDRPPQDYAWPVLRKPIAAAVLRDALAAALQGQAPRARIA